MTQIDQRFCYDASNACISMARTYNNVRKPRCVAVDDSGTDADYFPFKGGLQWKAKI